MEVANLLSQPVIGFITYVVPFLAVLSVIVFVHEYGHFQVARWCGVKVDTFSIGFGREIFGFTDRHGTRWKIGWLPLGGYVKFEGDANVTSMPAEHIPSASPGDFHNKPVSQRAAIVAAGPLANFILAILVFALSFSIVGVPVSQPRVDSVKEGSAAERAGIKAGDIIKAIDGSPIVSFSDIQRIVSTRAGEPLSIALDRGGSEIVVEATPERTEISDGAGGVMRVGLLGITRDPNSTTVYERKNPVEAVRLAGRETWFIIERSLSYVKAVIVGAESADQLAGPLRIAQMSGHAASISIGALVQLAAVLSISIGLINLFPIPMLDGGHLLFYAIEAARGRPLGRNAQEFGYKLGLALVLALMVAATWNDLVRLNLF